MAQLSKSAPDTDVLVACEQQLDTVAALPSADKQSPLLTAASDDGSSSTTSFDIAHL